MSNMARVLITNDSVLTILVQRYRICRIHMNALEMILNGNPVRFCQQCGRLHSVDEFEGAHRSCAKRLRQHAVRRQRARAVKSPLESGGGTTSDSQQEVWVAQESAAGAAAKSLGAVSTVLVPIPTYPSAEGIARLIFQLTGATRALMGPAVA